MNLETKPSNPHTGDVGASELKPLHYLISYEYLVCVLGFHRCVSGLGGGLHVDSGSSQVCGGGGGRLPAQPVSLDWSDGGHGGHLHQPRYSEARVKPSHDPGRPGLRLKITYSIISHAHLHLSLNSCGLIPLRYLPSLTYFLPFRRTVASDRSGDVKLQPYYSALCYHSVCHPKMLWEEFIYLFIYFSNQAG